MTEKRDNPGTPDYVSIELCEALRETITTKIDGIKNTIIISVSISTTVISAVIWLLKLMG